MKNRDNAQSGKKRTRGNRDKNGSGVSFHRNIEMVCKGKKGNAILSAVIDLLLIFISVYGAVMGFITSLDIGSNRTAILLGIAILTLFFRCIFQKKEWLKYVVPAAGILFLIISIVYFKELRSGFYHVINTLIPAVNEYYGIQILEYRVSPAGAAGAVTFFMLMFTVIMIVLTTSVVCGSGSRFLYFAGTVLLAAFPFAVGIVPDQVYLIAYAAATIVLIGNRFKVRQDIRTKVRIILLAVTFVLLSLVNVIFPEKMYKETVDIEQVKIDIQQGIRTFTEGDFWRDLLDGNLFSMGATAIGGLSGGRLGRVGEVVFDRKTALEVTVPEELGKFYLKGYVGNVYTAGGWEQQGKRDLEELRLLEEQFGAGYDKLASQWVELFGRIDYEPIGASALPAVKGKDDMSYSFVNMFQGDTLYPKEIQIKNVNAGRKNVFAPYLTVEDMRLDKNGKVELTKIGRRDEYKIQYMPDLERILEKLVLYQSPSSLNYAVDMIQKNVVTRYTLECLLGKTLEEYMEEDYQQNRDMTAAELLGGEHTVPNDFYDKVPYSISLFEGAAIAYYDDTSKTVNETIELVLKIEEFAKRENMYRQYVYDKYTALPDEGGRRSIELFREYLDGNYQTAVMNYISGNYWVDSAAAGIVISKVEPYMEKSWEPMAGERYDSPEDAGSYSLRELQNRILMVQSFLSDRASYSLKPGVTPRGEDFVDYFLLEQRKGYCSYYATAATLLFRSMGIPARYAEGYIVSDSDIYKGKKQNGKRIVDIKDTNAHAWTEIYVDGYGWLPVEVTPGYTGGDKIGRAHV